MCFVVVDKVKDSDSRFAFLRRKCFFTFCRFRFVKTVCCLDQLSPDFYLSMLHLLLV